MPSAVMGTRERQVDSFPVATLGTRTTNRKTPLLHILEPNTTKLNGRQATMEQCKVPKKQLSNLRQGDSSDSMQQNSESIDKGRSLFYFKFRLTEILTK